MKKETDRASSSARAQALNYGFDRAWENNNKGKLWVDVRKRLELEE